MKKYNVTVNGTAYEIVLEVVDAADIKAAPVAAPAPKAAPAAAGAVSRLRRSSPIWAIRTSKNSAELILGRVKPRRNDAAGDRESRA